MTPKITTDEEDQKFLEYRSIREYQKETSDLEDAMEYMRENYQPEDIFPTQEIEHAARALGMEYNDKN